MGFLVPMNTSTIQLLPLSLIEHCHTDGAERLQELKEKEFWFEIVCSRYYLEVTSMKS